MLNANNWADTSSALLQNDAIKTQVADFMVDQVYANVNVAGRSRWRCHRSSSRSPDPPPAAFDTVAQKAAFEFSGRPRVQEAWQARSA